MRKYFIVSVLCLFIVSLQNTAVLHADVLLLPKTGSMIALSPSYNPLLLKGMRVFPNNPLRFDFIVDPGEDKASDLKPEITKLTKYFLAALTVPEQDLWVNLSPYEKDRIVPESFGQTEMGRDLLAQDYMLKQLTASLIYPENELGRKFWNRIYTETTKKFGTTNVSVNTYNKVWIVPATAVVNEDAKSGTANITQSYLKVMLEEDYLATKKHMFQGNVSDQQEHATQHIIRDVILPELEKEVNEGKNFAMLRQVYSALILAAWYKQKIKDSILNEVYVDQNKIAGIAIKNPQEKQLIYQQYLQSFKIGVYNYIKEMQLTDGTYVPKKYFSGGFNANNLFDSAMSVLEVRVNEQGMKLEAQDIVSSVYLKELTRKNNLRRSFKALAKYAFIVIVGRALKSNHEVEKTGITDERYRLMFTDRIKEIYSGLIATAVEMVKSADAENDQKKIKYYVSFLNRLSATIAQGADLTAMSGVAAELSQLRRLFPEDMSVVNVRRALKRTQKIYWLDEKMNNPSKPTMLIVHGTGIGLFPSFNEFMAHYQKDYNIAFMIYDFRDPLMKNAERLRNQWRLFKKKYHINPAHELNQEFIVTYSLGDNVLNLAAMQEPALFENVSLLRIAPVILGSKLISLLNRFDPKGRLNRIYKYLAEYRDTMSSGNKLQHELLKAMENSVFGNRTLTLVPDEDHHLDFKNKRVWDVLERSPRLFLMEGTHLKAPSNPVTLQALDFLKELAHREDSGFSSLEPMSSDYGGIDLTRENLPLKVNSDGETISFNLDPAMRLQLNNAIGFEPVIFQINSLQDRPNFLGVNK